MGYFAVIDTETNWENQVMSIGTVIADGNTFQPVAVKYHVLDPEYRIGGMYEDVLFPQERAVPTLCARSQAMQELVSWFNEYGVSSMFAYNAAFDHKHMPELTGLRWYDIMRLAAYRQYNRKIPSCADCCSTGRLKRSYGVEPMMQLLSGNYGYQETHNALFDALDELEIMRLLGHRPESYIRL